MAVDALGTSSLRPHSLIAVDALGTGVRGTGCVSEVLRAGALHRPRALWQRRARRRFVTGCQPDILPLHPIDAAAGEHAAAALLVVLVQKYK